MAAEVSNNDNVIGSRDVIARIKELEGELADLTDDVENAATEEDRAVLMDALNEWRDDYGDELKSLQELANEAEGYAEDWQYGATLIRDSYWTDYVQELLEDLGELPRDLPSYIVIDWEATGDNIRADYTRVTFDGVDYWVR